jgi:hypothetical protein
MTSGESITQRLRRAWIRVQRWCTLLVAVTRLARFADHFSLRTTRTGWSFEDSPSRPAGFATASLLRVSMPVLSFSLSSTRAVDSLSCRAPSAG